MTQEHLDRAERVVATVRRRITAQPRSAWTSPMRTQDATAALPTAGPGRPYREVSLSFGRKSIAVMTSSWHRAPACGVLSRFHELDHTALNDLTQHTAVLLEAAVAAIDIVVGCASIRLAAHGNGDVAQGWAGRPAGDLPYHGTTRGRAGTVIADLAESASPPSPLILAGSQLRSYAAVPVLDPIGRQAGTLCVLDQRTDAFTSIDLYVLASLARDAAALLHLTPQRASW
ncbi:GAF domain-containing protein [Dactylosporangium sp. CS-047395]|uniref:GAF domain-containing protein n=1 Tax=Dactylosporangium sp. CS-047395 TaxID=3239936 RepID=UPI003D938EF5